MEGSNENTSGLSSSSSASYHHQASGGEEEEWCTIESDPGVFTELLERLGVTGVELQELWSLDDECLWESEIGQIGGGGGGGRGIPVYGLIFLFQYIGTPKSKTTTTSDTNSTEPAPLADLLLPRQRQPLPETEIPHDLFFAHQVTTNACATQAILSVLLNSVATTTTTTTMTQENAEAATAATAATTTTMNPEDGSFFLTPEQMGSLLMEFQSFTKDFPPSLKGVAISSSEEIKKCHNSFARQDAFFLEQGKVHTPTPGRKEEAFHFVAYVPRNGIVYELDGLQKGPIVVGDVASVLSSEDNNSNNAETTTTTTATSTGGGAGSSTTSGASIPSWIKVARQAIQERMALYQSTAMSSEGESGQDGIKFNLMAVTQDKRLRLAANPTLDATDREFLLQQEEAKRRQWKLENERRRHNYVPLCIQILKELALLGTLPELTQQATERVVAKNKSKRWAAASAGGP